MKGARGGSWPELGKKGSTGSSKGLELALGGAIGCWVQGGVAGDPLVAWKGTRRTNLRIWTRRLLRCTGGKTSSARAREGDT